VIEVALVVAAGETGGDIIVTTGGRVVPIFMRLSPRSLARAIRSASAGPRAWHGRAARCKGIHRSDPFPSSEVDAKRVVSYSAASVRRLSGRPSSSQTSASASASSSINLSS
jgi:hypothetical protein